MNKPDPKANLNTLTAGELIKKLAGKEITPAQILSALQARIKETDSKVKA